ELEMQEGMVFDRAPVAAEQGVGSDEIDGAGDPAAGPLGHDEENAVAHALSDERVELPVEIGAAPFARACLHVEGEEGVPDRLGQVGSGQPVHAYALWQRVAPLAPDRLALARSKRLEEVVETAVAGIRPVEL